MLIISPFHRNCTYKYIDIYHKHLRVPSFLAKKSKYSPHPSCLVSQYRHLQRALYNNDCNSEIYNLYRLSTKYPIVFPPPPLQVMPNFASDFLFQSIATKVDMNITLAASPTCFQEKYRPVHTIRDNAPATFLHTVTTLLDTALLACDCVIKIC